MLAAPMIRPASKHKWRIGRGARWLNRWAITKGGAFGGLISSRDVGIAASVFVCRPPRWPCIEDQHGEFFQEWALAKGDACQLPAREALARARPTTVS